MGWSYNANICTEYFLCFKATINNKQWLNCSTDCNIICLWFIRSDRILSRFAEYDKDYCCLLPLSSIFMRSIARKLSFRGLSLRSILRIFIVNLDKVKVRIGQIYRHNGYRTKYTCRLRTEWLSTHMVRVQAHEWNSMERARVDTQIVTNT